MQDHCPSSAVDLRNAPENVAPHILNNSVKNTLKGRLAQNLLPTKFKKLRAE